jgi:hypothetical protein
MGRAFWWVSDLTSCQWLRLDSANICQRLSFDQLWGGLTAVRIGSRRRSLIRWHSLSGRCAGPAEPLPLGGAGGTLFCAGPARPRNAPLFPRQQAAPPMGAGPARLSGLGFGDCAGVRGEEVGSLGAGGSADGGVGWGRGWQVRAQRDAGRERGEPGPADQPGLQDLPPHPHPPPRPRHPLRRGPRPAPRPGRSPQRARRPVPASASRPGLCWGAPGRERGGAGCGRGAAARRGARAQHPVENEAGRPPRLGNSRLGAVSSARLTIGQIRARFGLS